MAKAPVLQKLKHDKLITKATFPTFVETFNAITARTDNLKGDYDVNPAVGNITIDNTDWEHPVIRFVGSVGGGGATMSGYTGQFRVLTSATITSSAVVFSTMDLTYSSGLLVSASAGTDVLLDAQTYDNV